MVQDHFERHNHYEGVVDWNFNIVYNDQPSVAAMAQAYAPVLRQPYLYDPIPGQWLHATILRVGKVEDYSEAEMLAVAEKVQQGVQDLRLLEFHFGKQVQVFGAFCFRIEPEAELAKLYQVVVESLESVVGPERTTRAPYGDFIAHTSLAYSRQRDNEAETENLLHQVHIEPATFQVHHMPLIKQRPINGHYEWDIVKDIIIA